MCSIAGLLDTAGAPINNLDKKLKAMNHIQRHRGPDGSAEWAHPSQHVGFAHNRLSIIGLQNGTQPMTDDAGNWICFNGEIYNYLELRAELGGRWRTDTDTEVLLAAYRKWGKECVNHLTGMFSFAIWNEAERELFCARDRFGIKPFYFTQQENLFCFASEMKTLLPFLPSIETDVNGFKDYLFFQMCMNGKTMFKDIQELAPAHTLTLKNGHISIKRYWQVYYSLDLDHTAQYFEEELRHCFEESVRYHTRSDVPLGGYVSGGVDSSIIASIASSMLGDQFIGFTGKFSMGQAYDESKYAQLLADEKKFPLHIVDITSADFRENIENVLYYLDTPVAGPGSFSQYMVSKLAAKHRKVVLGGQGGDEIFGGYTRYLVAYLEQCLKGAIDGTASKNKYIVTLESMIPNMSALQQYKPMMKSFWSQGLFDDPDQRYFQLVNRAPNIGNCVHWDKLGNYQPFESFQEVFNASNVKVDSYLDRMTHFDFKTLLPALLQVEDRMSMAHGIESRVPFLDHRIVELVAKIPAIMKFKDGQMKYILRHAMKDYVPPAIMNRTDKMGFPTPFTEWAKTDNRDFIMDILTSQKARQRDFVDNSEVVKTIEKEGDFSRNLWGMLSIELWHRQFHDKAADFAAYLD